MIFHQPQEQKLLNANSPKFTHDCNACVFLGHLDGNDLYICDGDPAYVARFGDDGPDCRSLPTFVVNRIMANGTGHDLDAGIRMAYRVNDIKVAAAARRF
jgi:hypothetical protein